MDPATDKGIGKDMTQANTAPVAAMSFEQALQELEKIVGQLEKGDVSLEDSIAAYERGVALKNHCESKLKDAQLKIEKITTDESGRAVGAVEVPAQLSTLD